MAAASNLLSEDQFLCSICLKVFTDPVSTPCGHNFCKKCITEHWNVNHRCQCPVCNEFYRTRPYLKVNTFISEMVSQFKEKAQQEASRRSSEQQVSKPGEVPCDVCTGAKLKALKSCLVCLVSYCEIHLEPHLTVPGLKRHQLINPMKNLEDRMCLKHDKPLELFCKTDQMCVCTHCPALDHKTHDVAPFKEECEEKKAELAKTEAEIQQMIQRRRVKIQEIKQSVKLSKENARMEVADGVQVFTSLKESVERGLNELVSEIQKRQITAEKKAEGFIKELEQEITLLKKRGTEVVQLSRSEDQVHLLQNFPYLKDVPPTMDWTQVSVPPASYEGTAARALLQLEVIFNKKLKELLDRVELKRIQKYEVDVTLDPDTAHPELILSGDGKRVTHCPATKILPDKPERFSHYNFVVGKQSFSSGRFYFEVEVRGKPRWNLGVVKESINRKDKITMRPEGGYWTIWLRNGNEYRALTDPLVRLPLQSPPQKVGVFVDYEEGLVSFYDVDAAALIYSFTGCSFTEKLYPFFSPCRYDDGRNSAPLSISPVNQII